MKQDPFRSGTDKTEHLRQLWLQLLNACAKRVVQTLTPQEFPPTASKSPSTNTATGDDGTD